jgi:MinD-like ATPase involved in chromosome partitioning or flagellar assembly
VRTRLIAIAGAKGSPGCSFLAVTLARCFAASNISTLLLDGDAEGGGLEALLDLGSPPPAGAAGDPALDAGTVQIEPRLRFAEIGPDDAGRLNGLEVAGAVRARYQAVVLDLGHSAGGLQRQLSAASDWLLWVVVPDRSGLSRADRALGSGLLGAASSGLVFNRIRRGSLDRADEVLSSRHRMPVMARINEDRRIADRLSQGRPVHRDWSLRRTFRELARSVHPDAGSAAPAWP